jgi:hypothetical protein
MDAIANFPEYSGYIFLNDDCIMNAWNFFGKDKDKVWVQPHHSIVEAGSATPASWCWVKSQYGRAAYKRALAEMQLDSRERLKASFGKEDAILCGPADLFYLPAKLKKRFLSLFNIYSRHNVFTEMAVPTGLHAIAEQSQITVLNTINDTRFIMPFGSRSVRFDLKAKIFYNKNLLLYHPLKLSNQNNRKMVKDCFDIYYFKRFHLISLFKRCIDFFRPLFWFMGCLCGLAKVWIIKHCAKK